MITLSVTMNACINLANDDLRAHPSSQVVDVSYEVFEGDARNVLCEAVERHHAEMLVVGSHGYGALKRSCHSFFFTFLPLVA